MKITLVALIAGLCLVAVSANGGAFVQPEEIDLEYFPDDNADGLVDIEAFGFRKILKAALRTVKGLNCSIKAALLMKEAAEQGLRDIQACGAQTTKKINNIISTLNTIINICNDIIHLNQNVCQTEDDSANTTKQCFLKFLKKMFSLYRNIRKTISLIKKIPSSTTEAGACVVTASSKVSNTFMQFVPFVTECSKLTSN